MDENDVQKLYEISATLRRLNSKVVLLALLERAKREFDNNNYSECEKSCREILKNEPNNPIALRGLGCVMQIQGDVEEAIKYYNKALKKSLNKEIEYTLLGTIYYNQEDLDKAIDYYNMAIEVNENYDPAYEGRNQSMLENHLKIIDLQDDLIKQKLF